MRNDADFGATVFCADGSSESAESSGDDSEPNQVLRQQIVKVAQTGEVPVDFETTMEIYRSWKLLIPACRLKVWPWIQKAFKLLLIVAFDSGAVR